MQQLFRQYYNRIAREGWLKALVWGLAVGCAVFAVVAFVCWAVSFAAGVWIPFGAGIAVAAAVTVALYFLKYRPTTKAIARRLDSLGLEERMITMAELQKDETYIAMRQREDAREKLRTVAPKQISYNVSALSISLAGSFGALAVAMGIVFGLTAMGLLPGGSEVLTPEDPTQFVLVVYSDSDGGSVSGETDQMVAVGSDTEPVLAVADDGYVFVQWSDGVTEPSRSDTNVQEPLFVFAEFVEMEEGDGDDSDSAEPGDDASDMPADESESTSPSDPTDGEDGGNGSAGGSANHDYVDEGNGQVYYQELMDKYYELAMEQLASGGEISDGLRAFLEAYFGSLA